MHRSLRAAMAATALLISAASQAADIDVGVSIGISQPGVYGRIDIGRFPQPAVVMSQPVYVVKQPRHVEPVYLWVPPGHQKNWRKHCHRYQACGVPVYFVRDDWYERHVRHSDRRDGYREDRHDQRRGDRRNERGDERREHPGKGHGRDKHRD
ncbi:MAG: hypothetical protein ACK4F7_01400 [Inhella sp.]